MTAANLTQSIRLRELGWNQENWIAAWYKRDYPEASYEDLSGIHEFDCAAPTTDEILDVLLKKCTHIHLCLGNVGTDLYAKDTALGVIIDVRLSTHFQSKGLSVAEALADLLIKLLESKEIKL